MRSWCVPQNFLYPHRDQPLLLPVDMREWLSEDDLVFVVLDVVATLDLGEFRRRYRADGHGWAARPSPHLSHPNEAQAGSSSTSILDLIMT